MIEDADEKATAGRADRVALWTATLATAHAGPALASIGPLRARIAPSLAGIGDASHIALTFDDGPDPQYTPRLLRLLDELRVSATFFLLGKMLCRSPELAREIHLAGHEIGLHGYNHRPLLIRGPRSTFDDLARGRDLVEEVTGVRVERWRPPYGVLTGAALASARSLRLRPVLWTAWGRDWTRSATAASVLATVEAGLRPGGTILLHDSDCTSAPGSSAATLAALPELVARSRARGLAVGPLRAHGLGLDPRFSG